METSSTYQESYKTSRILYIIEACFENFIIVLVTGAFLATLTSRLGISDSLTAILSSIASLSYLFQLVSIYLAHKTPVKRWVIPIQLLAHIMFASLYLLPVLNIKRGAAVIFFMLVLGAYTLKSIIQPIKINWFYSLVSPKKQGSFTAILTAISVIGQIFFSLFASLMFDHFVNSGNDRAAFVSLTITIFIIIVADIIPLIFSKEKKDVIPTAKQPSPFSSISDTIKNRGFLVLIISGAISSIGSGMTAPFLATYQINELGFSLSFVAIIDIIVNAFWIGSLFFFGRLSSKKSYAFVLRTSYILRIFSTMAIIITVPSNGAILFTIYRIIEIIARSAFGVSSRSLLLGIVEAKNRTSALSLYTVITGVITFLTTLAMTPIVSAIQSNGGINIFSFNLYAQQFIAIINVFVLIILNIYVAIRYKQLKIEIIE